MSISAKWYVLVTSPSTKREFATMGPYPTKATAVHAAEASLECPTTGSGARVRS